MTLNSSKIVILTLLVILISGCVGDSSFKTPTSSISAAKFTPTTTIPFTPVPSEVPSTSTPAPTDTGKAILSPTIMASATSIPVNVSKFPDPILYIWEVIATGFSRPTGISSAMDGSNRLFILEQEGLILILQDGKILEIPFLDLRNKVSTQGSTVRGLLGIAFHPKFDQNGYFYVHYTKAGGNSIISRFQVSGNPDIADPDSETQLLEISYPIGEHIGGGLAFGPDNYLYISIGDGGAGGNGDQAGNAQNPETLPGSILRLDLENTADPEVWAFGLRNPWRFSFDSLNGDLYIADVGENQWEEIDYLPAGSPKGSNFGWNYYEGNQSFKENPPEKLDVIFPIWTYDHTMGCSVTGGYVYRGQQLPDWFGVYFYGDYCSGNIWGLLQNPDHSWQNESLFKIPAYITSFGQDQTGEIFLTSVTGKIYKLVKK